MVYCVAWGFDGKLLASGGADNKIILWDPEKGERLKTLEGHSDWVRSVAWRFDGRLLASGGADNNIILWDPEKGKRLKTLEGHRLAKLFFFCLPRSPVCFVPLRAKPLK